MVHFRSMHPILSRLRAICIEKETNLSVAADLTSADAILDLAERVGDAIAIFKTHVDIITDFTPDFTRQLRAIADRRNFLLFEDRKFADIGNTVSLQFGAGVYHIADWADIVNAHTIVGPGIIEGLAKVNKRSALLLLAQMTPAGNLFTPDYARSSVAMACNYPDFVIGFIGSSDQLETLRVMRDAVGDTMTIMTPGIQLGSSGDGLGQTYNTPETAIKNGADIIIVGRGIYGANDPAVAAEVYRAAGWAAYLRAQAAR